MPPSALAVFSNCWSACWSALPRNAPPPVSGRMTLISRSAACATENAPTSVAATRNKRTPNRSSQDFWRFVRCSGFSISALRCCACHFLVCLVLFEAGENLHLLVGGAERAPGNGLLHHALIGTKFRLRQLWRDVPDHPRLLRKGLRRIDHQPAELHDRDVAGAEALLRAVGDRAHRFPHRDVLVGNAGN